MLLYSENKRSIIYIFFVFFFLELCLGGSGGLLKYDLITLRKVDFVIALIISIFIYLFINKIDQEIISLTLVFLVLLLFGATIGFLNYGNDVRIYENFFMQSFFLLLPFYTLFIRQKKDAVFIVKIFIFSSVLLAVAYLILLLLMFTGITPFLTVYGVITQSDEFMGRGGFAIWYKGFLYMCAGIYFVSLINNKFIRSLLQVIIFIALVLTFTRGFIAALFATAILYNFFFKNIVRSMIIVVIGVLGFVYLSSAFEEVSFDRAKSDEPRYLQIEQVGQGITPLSFFIGHGLGAGVKVRDNHMEINYLEIFHKQGIIGVIFWFFILGYIVFIYRHIKLVNTANEKYARPFLLATIFVYIESFTNPFLTNSIGMNIVMVSLVCLNVLKKQEPVPVLPETAGIL